MSLHVEKKSSLRLLSRGVKVFMAFKVSMVLMVSTISMMATGSKVTTGRLHGLHGLQGVSVVVKNPSFTRFKLLAKRRRANQNLATVT